VRIEGDSLHYFASSSGVRRGFCAACGTSLCYENERWPDDLHLMLGALEEPNGLAPQFHIFTEQRLKWLCLADPLPRYRTTPSAGELMPAELPRLGEPGA
jgi:hypothetical protein